MCFIFELAKFGLANAVVMWLVFLAFEFKFVILSKNLAYYLGTDQLQYLSELTGDRPLGTQKAGFTLSKLTGRGGKHVVRLLFCPLKK